MSPELRATCRRLSLDGGIEFAYAAGRASIIREGYTAMREIPGIVGLHAVISDQCRLNRSEQGAIDEALARARSEMVTTLPRWAIGNGVKFHVIFTVEKQSARPNTGGQLYTERYYPCGCSAKGQGDVPAYCGEHDQDAVKDSPEAAAFSLSEANDLLLARAEAAEELLRDIPEMLLTPTWYGDRPWAQAIIAARAALAAQDKDANG